jgi:hypothetical protein
LPGFEVEGGKADFRESWRRKSRLFREKDAKLGLQRTSTLPETAQMQFGPDLIEALRGQQAPAGPDAQCPVQSKQMPCDVIRLAAALDSNQPKNVYTGTPAHDLAQI